MQLIVLGSMLGGATTTAAIYQVILTSNYAWFWLLTLNILWFALVVWGGSPFAED